MSRSFYQWLVMAFALSLLAAGPASAARTAEIYEPEIEVPAGKNLSDVKSAIRKAFFARDWRAKDVGANQMQGQHTKSGRKGVEHKAVVLVKYDSKTIKIQYKESEELKYDPETKKIHGTYNKWVKNLEKDIRANLGAY